MAVTRACTLSFISFSTLFRFKIFVFFCVFAFLSNTFNCQHSHRNFTKDVSSVVGAPWRCGVLTT